MLNVGNEDGEEFGEQEPSREEFDRRIKMDRDICEKDRGREYFLFSFRCCDIIGEEMLAGRAERRGCAFVMFIHH